MAFFDDMTTALEAYPETNVRVRVKGLSGVTVKGPGAAEPFGADALPNTMQVAAHGGSAIGAGTLSFKAPDTSQPRKDLFRATLDAWDADINHLLLNHSEASKAVVATYAAAVVTS